MAEGRPEKNPASGRVEALNPGLPDYNTGALNHSAALNFTLLALPAFPILAKRS